MKKAIIIIPIILAIILGTAIVRGIFASNNPPTLSIDMATTTEEATSTSVVASTTDIIAPKGVIHVLVSDTDATREQGLSGYDPLPADRGMLFVFPEDGSYAFWMKDMKFALDMVWIDSAKTVVGVTPNISPDTYPDTFLPPSLVKYVLEIDANDAGQLGIATGTQLSF